MQLLWQWRRLWQLLKLLRLQLPGQIYDGHPKKKRDRNWTLVRPSWAVSLNIWKKKKKKKAAKLSEAQQSVNFLVPFRPQPELWLSPRLRSVSRLRGLHLPTPATRLP